ALAVQSLKISGVPANLTVNTSQSFTVEADDVAGIRLTNFTGTVHFTITDPQATIPADYTFMPQDQGIHTFSFTPRTGGSQVLSAETPSFASGVANILVDTAVDHLQVVVPTNAVAGTPFSATVKALDKLGNVARTYRGTVHFTS